MNVRILVTGEADVAQFPRLPCLLKRPVHAVLPENAIRVFEANDFMMLHEIDAVHLETPERFFELGVRRFGGAAVDLGHHKGSLAISFAQRFAQAFLARALVIVPGVIHKRDAVVDRGADDANGQRLRDVFGADM